MRTLQQPFVNTLLEMLQGQKGLREGHCSAPGKPAGVSSLHWILGFLIIDCNQSSYPVTNCLKLLK